MYQLYDVPDEYRRSYYILAGSKSYYNKALEDLLFDLAEELVGLAELPVQSCPLVW